MQQSLCVKKIMMDLKKNADGQCLTSMSHFEKSSTTRYIINSAKIMSMSFPFSLALQFPGNVSMKKTYIGLPSTKMPFKKKILTLKSESKITK